MDTETETLKQLATIVYNKPTENNIATKTNTQELEKAAPLLRVPSAAIQQQQTQEEWPATPEPSYHQKSQPKNEPTNTNSNVAN